MPKCKNCGMQLSRLDKEVCPFCGTVRPIEGQDDSTEDVTKTFDPIKYELEDVPQKSRVTAGVLAMTLGIFGVHAFYLGRKKLGFILIAITISFIAGLGCTLFFTGAIPNILAFLIPYFVLETAMIVSGVLILTRRNETDGNGEFLK